MKQMKKQKKTFDCVAFKRKAQSRIRNQVKDLTPEAEIEWFGRAALSGPLGDWWKEVVQASSQRAQAVAESRGRYESK